MKSFLIAFSCMTFFASVVNGTIVGDSFYVGPLHKKWQFCSDHVPIGGKISLFRIAAWNVLNDRYMNYIIEDSQGLNKSLITTLYKGKKTSLSPRELVIYKQLKDMLTGKNRRALIGLLEVSPSLLNLLKDQLSCGWKILYSPSPHHQEDLYLYDSRKLTIVESATVEYSKSSSKIVFYLKVEEKKSLNQYRIFLTHVPQGKQGLSKLASTMQTMFDPHYSTLLMGDMNSPPKCVIKALSNKGMNFSPSLSVYPTHVNTKKQACWFDGFFVYSPTNTVFFTPEDAPLVFPKMYTTPDP
jgi:hypothetical protein